MKKHLQHNSRSNISVWLTRVVLNHFVDVVPWGAKVFDRLQMSCVSSLLFMLKNVHTANMMYTSYEKNFASWLE